MEIRLSIRKRLERLVARQRLRIKAEAVLFTPPGLALFIYAVYDLATYGRRFDLILIGAWIGAMFLITMAGMRVHFLQHYDRRADFLKDPDPIRKFEIKTSRWWHGKKRVLTAWPVNGTRIHFPLPTPQEKAFETDLSAEMSKLLEDDDHSVLV